MDSEIPSFWDTAMSETFTRFFEAQEKVIRERLTDLGFDPDDTEFIKSNMQKVVRERDDFDHYYYRFGQSDEVRIISIQRHLDQPPLDINNPDFSSRMTISKKYY